MSDAIETLGARLDALEQHVTERTAAIDDLGATLASLTERRDRMVDLLGTDELGRLALRPLVAVLIGSVASLTSVFLTYLIGLFCLTGGQPESETPITAVLWALALLAGFFGAKLGKRPGAGGSARALLGPLSLGLVALSGVAGAVILVLGYS